MKESQSTQVHTQSRESQNPQSHSLRKAAARLKEKQAQIQMLKNRFKVLKGQQDYNRYRTLDQQKRIKKHNALHQSIKADRSSLQRQIMKQKNKDLQSLRQKHDKLKAEIKENSKDAYQSLYTSRLIGRRKLKEESFLNQNQIQKSRQEQIEQKSKRKQSIISEEKRRKQYINRFKQTKAQNTLGNRSMEASRISLMTNQRDKQLQRLMCYQQEMLKKASQSIAMNHKVKSEYSKVFVQVKEKNSCKFPSIHKAKTGTPNYSQISRNFSIYEI